MTPPLSKHCLKYFNRKIKSCENCSGFLTKPARSYLEDSEDLCIKDTSAIIVVCAHCGKKFHQGACTTLLADRYGYFAPCCLPCAKLKLKKDLNIIAMLQNSITGLKLPLK